MHEYLNMTNQDISYLFGGIFTFGLSQIIHEIVPEALRQQKKIVWHNSELDLWGKTTYSFENLQTVELGASAVFNTAD